MSEKTMSDVSIRAVMDGIEGIMGTNGLKTILNYAKLSYLFDNKPPYSFAKNYTEEEFAALTDSIYVIVGIRGATALIRLIGREIAKFVIEQGMFASTLELEGEERFLKIVDIYIMVTERGRVYKENDIIYFDYKECTGCKDKVSKSPMCSTIVGFFSECLRWVGLDDMEIVETKCKAVGDETCLYEIRPINRDR